MSSQVCVDANILIKLVLPDKESELVDQLWAQWKDAAIEVVAPPLLFFEITSVLHNAVWRKLLNAEEGRRALELTLRLPVRILSPAGLHRRAWLLAQRFGCSPSCSMHYLALAEMLGCEFWTADQQLHEAVKAELPWVRWLGDYKEGLPVVTAAAREVTKVEGIKGPRPVWRERPPSPKQPNLAGEPRPLPLSSATARRMPMSVKYTKETLPKAPGPRSEPSEAESKIRT